MNENVIRKMNCEDRDVFLEVVINALNHSDWYGAMVQRINTGKSSAGEYAEVQAYAEQEYSTCISNTRYHYYAYLSLQDGKWLFSEHFFIGDEEVTKSQYEKMLLEMVAGLNINPV
jgi:hypothetical protein